MSAFLSPVFGTPMDRALDSLAQVLSGGKLYTYQAGSTTPMATWTNSTQAVQNANPIVFDSAGLLAQEVWLQAGQSYKFILRDSNGNQLAVADNVSGINDTSAPFSEWVATGLTVTYSSATVFTVAGDQTAVFYVGRRTQATVSAGTIYSTISASSFAAGITTVTVVNDSGALDVGLSAVNVGLLNPVRSSVNTFNAGVIVPAGTVAAPSIRMASAAGVAPDAGTGWYHIGANNWGWSGNGAKMLDLSTTGLAITGLLTTTGNVISSSNVYASGGKTGMTAASAALATGSVTKTCTVTMADSGAVALLVVAGGQVFGSLGNSSALWLVCGDIANNNYAVTAVSGPTNNGSDGVISAITKNSGNFTFTFSKTNGVQAGTFEVSVFGASANATSPSVAIA